MKIFDRIAELRHYLDLQRKKGRIIGLVPTMGALHEGHAQLIRSSVRFCDLTVCSIFVNPTQFNNESDLVHYPKRMKEDQQLLEAEQCEVIFAPSVEEMYPNNDVNLKFDFGRLERVMEGEFRPGHFSGVGIVVSKLLNIVQPHRAFFGQKDLQQLAVIKKLVRDLNVPTEIISVPTVREPNGLAMSSRNLRLSEGQKEVASTLHAAMQSLKEEILSGAEVNKAKSQIWNALERQADLRIEYIEVVDSEKMTPISAIDEAMQVSICMAAFVGDVRLIDNLYLKS